MNNGKSILDQIQDALGKMEDTGFLDELANDPEAEGEEDEGASPAKKPPLKSGDDDTSS